MVNPDWWPSERCADGALTNCSSRSHAMTEPANNLGRAILKAMFSDSFFCIGQVLFPLEPKYQWCAPGNVTIPCSWIASTRSPAATNISKFRQ